MHYKNTNKNSSPPLTASIIIPTHNSSGYIENAINSVVSSHTQLLIEIIIVDDASSDIDELIAKIKDNKTIQLIQKQNKSNAAFSRNLGFTASKSDFVFFLDSDDSYSTTYIQDRVNHHIALGCGLVFGNYIEKNGNIEIKKNLPSYPSNDIRDYLFTLGGDIRSSTISIYKANHKGTLFDPEQNKHQDWGYGIRAYDAGENISFDSKLNVYIDNTTNPSRMSNRMNVTASEYFINTYISNPSHIIHFAKLHLKLSIASGDTEGLRFLRSILIPTLKKTPIPQKLHTLLLCAATLPIFKTVVNFIFIKTRKNREST